MNCKLECVIIASMFAMIKPKILIINTPEDSIVIKKKKMTIFEGSL